jgi:hypothetical protein
VSKGKKLVAVSAFLGAVCLAGCQPTATATSSSASSATATASQAVTSAAPPAEESTPTAAASTSIDTPTAAASSATPTLAPAQVTVPDVIGTRLLDAQTAIEGVGLTQLPSDVTGQDRAVLNPQNWLVKTQSPAAGSKVAAGSQVDLGVAKPSDAPESAAGSTKVGVVPNVVCFDLQKAQDTLQAAGFFNLGSEDGSGQGRMQLVDRNWVVTKQSAKAGSKPEASTRIVLTAVKFGEPTGSSGCKD